MENYTSLKLSKLLYENGFRGKSNLVYINSELRYKRQDNLYNPIPAYDILNDLCVKYAKEIFGGEEIEDDEVDLEFSPITRQILFLLQQNKQEEAENYIWEHCLFNH